MTAHEIYIAEPRVDLVITVRPLPGTDLWQAEAPSGFFILKAQGNTRATAVAALMAEMPEPRHPSAPLHLRDVTFR